MGGDGIATGKLSVGQGKESDVDVFVLSNGLRCVFRRSKGVSYCGIAVGAGTRDESVGEYGLAHFVEHTLFKGTTSRRSWHISSRMESVGGELNAYTTKEETLVYTVAPPGYVERALELLSDLVCNSVFPTAELEKEKEVVIDEINSYLDSPSEAIFDEFEDLLYAGSGLGHNILGTPESVKGLGSEECLRFLNKHYTPGRMVVYCVADEEPHVARRLLSKYFSGLTREDIARERVSPGEYVPFHEVRDNSRHQSHTLMGTRIFGRTDPRRYALFLLNNYLGGPSMNSVLNRELRDKRGYVYTVDSLVGLLSDCGSFQVYFGCDREHVRPCSRIVTHALEHLAEHTLKPRVFEAARRQYLGQLQVAASYADSQAMNLGKTMLYYDRIVDVGTTSAALRRLCAEDVRDVARLIVDRGLSSLTLC